MRERSRWAKGVLLAAVLVLVAPPLLAAARDGAGWSVVRHGAIGAKPPSRLPPGLVSLLLDDGSREADVGYNGATAFQFLWFNRFDTPVAPGEAFDLQEIQVLFPPGPGIVPGAAVQLAAWSDADGNPMNGAVLRWSYDTVIQSADGTTFSIYPVDPPVRFPAGSGDVLVGVVDRYVSSGVSAPSQPAALDTTASAGRSWIALWTGDPPDPPSLPSDNGVATIDTIVSGGGNWMIRASGLVVPVAVGAIPTLGEWGIAALAALLVLTAVAVLRRS